MISSRIAAILIALAFVSGAFIASPELRAYAAATITSADIVDGTIRSVDIGSGEVKTADIGNGQVTSAKIKDANVMTSDLANDAVTSEKLADNVFDDLQSQIDALIAENAAQQGAIDDLTARVEALEGGGTDPNDVDDDSDGYTENQGDCDDSDPARNPGATDIAENGIDEDCDGTDSIASDLYEPNDSLATAANIGSTSEVDLSPIQINANMHLTSDEDWYSAQVNEEDSSLAQNDLNVVVTLSNIPTGNNYDLFASGSGDCVTTITDNTKSGNASESITIVCDDDSGSDDSSTLQIEVRNVSDTASADEYTLTISAT